MNAKSIKSNFVLILILSNLVFAFYYLFPNQFPVISNQYAPRELLTHHDADLVILSFFLVTAYYITFGFYFFDCFWNFSSKLCGSKELIEKYFNRSFLSIFIALNQIALLLFYFITGYGKAGGKEIVENNLKYYFVFFPVDYLFFVYYAVGEKSKLLELNKLIYLVSSVARGWLGGILFIILFELFRLAREKSLKLSVFYSGAFFLFLISPFLNSIKFYIRSGTTDISSYSFLDKINYMLGDLTNLFSYIQDIEILINSLIYDTVYRFQHLTSLIGVIEYRDELYNAFTGNQFNSFFISGPTAVFLRRFPDYQEKVNLPEYLTYILQSSKLSDAWSTNPTILGWLFFSDFFWMVLYIIYMVFLMLGTSYLMRRISNKYSAMDVLWVIWITLFLSGWFDAILSFIQAQIIIIIFIHFQKIILRSNRV